MKMPRPLQALGIPTGFSGLLVGLFLLDREPLMGVLAMLGAMTLLLGSLAKLSESRRTGSDSFRR